MAKIIPSLIPSRATAGEKRLHRILSRLPGDCVVYYEPDIGGQHPDFVALCPDLGVLVIEDKNWRPDSILAGDRHSITIHPQYQEAVKVTHPERQALDYVNRLREAAHSGRTGGQFLRTSGSGDGDLRVPISYLVTLSRISRVQLDEPSRCLPAVFNEDWIATSDEVRQWEGLSSAGLLDTLRSRVRSCSRLPEVQVFEFEALSAILEGQVTDSGGEVAGVSLSR